MAVVAEEFREPQLVAVERQRARLAHHLCELRAAFRIDGR